MYLEQEELETTAATLELISRFCLNIHPDFERQNQYQPQRQLGDKQRLRLQKDVSNPGSVLRS